MNAEHYGIVAVFTSAGHLKYFREFREIKRGRSKGQVEITLTNGRKVKVLPTAVVRWPAAHRETQPCHTVDHAGASASAA